MSDSMDIIEMIGVKEYAEGMQVMLRKTTGIREWRMPGKPLVGFGREVIFAKNEGGYNSTEVDLEQLLNWVAENRPEQYMKFVTENMMRKYEYAELDRRIAELERKKNQ